MNFILNLVFVPFISILLLFMLINNYLNVNKNIITIELSNKTIELIAKYEPIINESLSKNFNFIDFVSFLTF
jgi:hypothetical protein